MIIADRQKLQSFGSITLFRFCPAKTKGENLNKKDITRLKKLIKESKVPKDIKKMGAERLMRTNTNPRYQEEYYKITEKGAKEIAKNKRLYLPENGKISDIYYRVSANLPISLPYDLRGFFDNEWKELEKRIKKYYIEKEELI